MTIEWFIALLCGLFAIGFAARWVQTRRRKGTPESTSEDDSQLDFNEKFLRLGRAEDKIKLVRTFIQADNLSIRAMLDAADIPSYCDDNSMGNLYPGLTQEAFSDAVILVYQNDLESAREIVNDFIEERKTDIASQAQTGGNALPRVLPEFVD